MYKEFEDHMKELHHMAADMASWEAGCLELFGDPEISQQEAIKAIRRRGAEQIIKNATWYKADTSNGYEAWLQEKVRTDKLPKHLSLDAFLDEFHDQLVEAFTTEKQEDEKR